jgi:AraC-like DNA-binding protein
MLVNLLFKARAAIDHDIETAARAIDTASAVLQSAKPFPSARDGNHEQVRRRGGLAPWQMNVVRMHIDANLSSSLTVHKLAALTRLSESYFARAFKASFDAPPHAYVLRRRIERAVHLIRTTRDPLSSIALECGLSDQSHLSRMFKLHIGESPAAWRRRHCAGQN